MDQADTGDSEKVTPPSVEDEREACALIADAAAEDLVGRAAEGMAEHITAEQVVNGYRMIAKLIRARSRPRRVDRTDIPTGA